MLPVSIVLGLALGMFMLCITLAQTVGIFWNQRWEQVNGQAHPSVRMDTTHSQGQGATEAQRTKAGCQGRQATRPSEGAEETTGHAYEHGDNCFIFLELTP